MSFCGNPDEGASVRGTSVEGYAAKDVTYFQSQLFNMAHATEGHATAP